MSHNYKSIKLKLSLVWIGFFFATHLSATGTVKRCQNNEQSAKVVSIRYGTDNTLSYNLLTGMVNIYSGNKLVINNSVAVVKIGGQTISSLSYNHRTYQQKAIQTNFGKGIEHIITLSGGRFPLMKQVYYTYNGRNYILSRVTLKGKNLKSNYMAPIQGNVQPFSEKLNTLFVPFDNDTFISYRSSPVQIDTKVTSSEVGVIYDNDSRIGLIIGSVEHEVWKSGVQTSRSTQQTEVTAWGGYTDPSVNRDSIAHGSLEGDEINSPMLFVGFYNDWRTGMNDYAAANRLQEPPYVFNWTQPTPVGWNSWGVIQDHLTYDKAIKVVDFFADSLSKFRSGNTAYIDLDAFWDFMVKGGNKGDFTVLNNFVKHCRDKGLQPGVYFAPFADFGYKHNGNRLAEGTNYDYKDLWTKVGLHYHDIDGGRALDPTHPGTLQHVAYMIKKLRDCGFKMIKVDFLAHAAAESTRFYDSSTTTGMQAFRKGMEYLDDQLGSQMLIYAAISPSLATSRYVHSRRIACDAFKTIDHTKYTLNSVTYGWWQTWLYNFVDADHVVLADQPEGANRARMLSSVITGTFITGDDFSLPGLWAERAKQWYQNPELLKVVAAGKAFEPVEGLPGIGASNMFVRKSGNDFYLAVFNYGKMQDTFNLDFARLGLKAGTHYQGLDILSGNFTDFSDKSTVVIAAADAVLYKISAK